MTRVLGLLGLCAVAACGSRPLNPSDGGATGSAGQGGAGGSAGQPGGVAGATGLAGRSGSTSPGLFTLTQWRVPFADSEPFQIAAVSTGVVYVNKDAEQHLGHIDTLSGVVTEWPLPYTATSPGGIEVRASDGAVFVTGATLGEIGQFDLGTQVLRRWKLPLEDSGTDAGPYSLAVGPDGRVYFGALASGLHADSDTVIGRLDTATGTIETWTYPDHTAPRVSAGPNGTVLFNIWGGGSNEQGIARLDTATSVFTVWPLALQLAYPAVADSAGNVFVQIVDSSFLGLARLVPDSGWLAEWATPDEGQDCLRLLSDRVYFARAGGMSLAALDPRVPGRDIIVTPVMHAAVAQRRVTVTPVMTTLVGQQAQSTSSFVVIESQVSGAFETWALPGAPRMIATVGGNVYVTEDGSQTVLRLQRFID